MFLAFSCKPCCTCPSCHRKRALLTSIHVAEVVCASVADRQVVLTIPKRLPEVPHTAPCIAAVNRRGLKFLSIGRPAKSPTCARGGFTVDIEWKDGKVTNYRIRSKEPREVKLRVNGETKTIKSGRLLMIKRK